MARPPGRESGASYSLLDRLLDDDPTHPQEDPYAMTPQAGRLKNAMARDLEELLNSRRLPDWEVEGFPRAADSVLMFGISDLTGFSIHDPRSLRSLQEHLRKTIERFEPRLGSVRVGLEPSREAGKMLRFRVDAVMRNLPGRPSVTYDATLQLGTQTCMIQQR